MKKHELREQGFIVTEKKANKWLVFLASILFTALLIAGTFVLLVKIISYTSPLIANSEFPIDFTIMSDMVPFYFIEIIAGLIIYSMIKIAVAAVFCSDKKNSVALTFIEGKDLPVCQCREALKPWQVILIYLIPIVSIYIPMFWLCVGSVGDYVDSGFMTMMFIMEFIMGFDLTLIVYILILKAKDKMDYIAVNHHIYNLTLFNKTYIKTKKKTKKDIIETDINETKTEGI